MYLIQRRRAKCLRLEISIVKMIDISSNQAPVRIIR